VGAVPRARSPTTEHVRGDTSVTDAVDSAPFLTDPLFGTAIIDRVTLQARSSKVAIPPSGSPAHGPNRLRFPGLYIGVHTVTPVVEPRGGARPDDFARWLQPSWVSMTRLASRLVGTLDAEDVVQEAVTTAWRKWDRFDASRGTPRAWLLSLTADHARRHWRRMASLPMPIAEIEPAPHAESSPDLDLRAEVIKLRGQQRLAVELYYYLDLPVSEVAQVMRCSEGTVKSTLSDARARLRRSAWARSQDGRP
jgi:RNA polymerase sigma factor (sigma-70 family)